MKNLTKIAIAGTVLSAATLFITGDVIQTLGSDGEHLVCTIYWHIPFYRTLQLPHSTWWTFTRIWLVSLSIPPILWVGVGISKLVTKFRPRSS